MKKKKFLSVLLAVLMLLTSVTVGFAAFADDTTEADQVYSVSVSPRGRGSASLNKSKVSSGETVTITLKPEAGYGVSQVLVNGDVDKTADVVENKLELVITQDTYVSVSFGELRTISVTAGEGGTVDPTGTVTAAEGANIEFDITPDAGYQIASVLVGEDDRTVDVLKNGKLALTVEGDTTVTVTFKKAEKFNISFSVIGSGSVSLDKSQAYYGETVDVTFKPNAGYGLSQVLVNGADKTADVTADNKLAILVTQDTEIEAVFAKPYEIAVNVSDDQGGTAVANKETAMAGESVEITITPDAGYQIASVMVGEEDKTADVKDGKLILTVTGDTEVTVTFEKMEFTVSVHANTGGRVQTNASVVEFGGTVTATITPDAGYGISKVTVNGEDKTAEVQEGKLAFVITQNTTLEVTFAELYDISVEFGEGGTAVANKETAMAGEDVEINITPDTGYKIASVMVGEEDKTADVKDGKLTLTVAGNTEVTVTFEKVIYNISVKYGEGGKAEADKAEAAVGDTVTVVITPDTGYKIASVMVGEEDKTADVKDGKLTLTVAGNTEVNVTFAEIEKFDVTANVSGKGTATADKAAAAAGETVTVTIAPATGWQLDKVLVNDEDKTADVADSKLVLTVTEDTVIDVTFTEIPPQEFLVSVAAGENGTITPNGESTVTAGDSVKFAINAAAGYVIDTLTVNGEVYSVASGQNAYDFTITIEADTNVEVTFKLVTTAQVMVSYAELKDAADGNSETVLDLSLNDRLNVIGEDGIWYQVEITKGGTTYTGYVEKIYVKIVAGQAKSLGIIVANKATIYNNTAESSVESTLSRNLYVYIDGIVGDYYLVSFSWGGWHYGYISKDYVRDNDLDRNYTVTKEDRLGQVMIGEAVVRDAADVNSAPVTVIPKNGYVFINDDSIDGWYKVSLVQTADAIPYEGYIQKWDVKIVDGDPKPLGQIAVDSATIYNDAEASSVESTLDRGLYVYLDGEVGDYYIVSFSWGGWHQGYVLKSDVNVLD